MTVAEPLHVAPRPCGTCPYRRDTPPGVWAPEEYEKLRTYDDAVGHVNGEHLNLAVFLCHQTNATGIDTACKGWLAVHPDHVAVRLAQLRGSLTPEQVWAPCPVDVYDSGTEAADAGLAGVPNPTHEAQSAMKKLKRQGAAR